MARTFDVWVQSSNTVYKGVPFNVVTDWAQQGRLAATDRIRTSGTEDWSLISDDPIISDFLFVKRPVSRETPFPSPGPVVMDVVWAQSRDDEDDDVDMIPLIDISLVLLIFFMMTAAVSSLSPIDVPQLSNIHDAGAPADALTITIDKRSSGEANYALRIGEKVAEAVDNDLDTLAQLLERLDIRLGESRGPTPEVRFACHRDLPSERVHELLKELETRKKAGRIGLYRAEVNEKK